MNIVFFNNTHTPMANRIGEKKIEKNESKINGTINKCILIILLFVASLTMQAQTTTFLGIPVDGTKTEMIQKLKNKGFKQNAGEDWLTGEFNGNAVMVSVVTNNNKVYRVCVIDAYSKSEGDIIIRYNHLVSQFQNNARYTTVGIIEIPDNEDFDLEYELVCNNKRYQASFIQNRQANNSVWFMIDYEYDYGRYRIITYYDNNANAANGEDL